MVKGFESRGHRKAIASEQDQALRIGDATDACDGRIRSLSGKLNLRGIHWVIVGGESGAKARPMEESWAERVRTQAVAQGVPFFFKQWGAWGADGVRRDKKRNGRELSGRRWDEFPVAVVAA